MRTIFLVVFSFWAIALFAGNESVDKTIQAKEWLKNQPLAFIENKGQFTNSDGKPADNVLFKASYGNCDIYITTEGISYVFHKYETSPTKSIDTNAFRRMPGEKTVENKNVSYYRLDMNLQGSAINKTQIIKELPGKQGVTNYFYPHCPDGIYSVQEYGKITIKNIYKGIDWVIYTNAENKEAPLKYDFVVQPQANYKDIKIKFVNAQNTSLTDNGTKLKIQTIAGNIEEGNLYSYLQNSTEKQAIKTNYIANSDSTFEFELGAYDKTKTLVIDPLVWATYYGGGDLDYLYSICTDSEDNIYVTGMSNSLNFPTISLPGAYSQALENGIALVILKFNIEGVRLWATFYTGNLYAGNMSTCVDSKNNIYVTGALASSDFPTQNVPGAFFQLNSGGITDAFILKFNKFGTRQWATYYGGNSMEYVNSICTDTKDNIYITGATSSADFPTQKLTGGFNQSALTGWINAFILKFNDQGVRQWATYYGGSNRDWGYSIGTDSKDNILIAGQTDSPDFPTQPLIGAYNQSNYSEALDVFILKFNSEGIRQWSTYYGGNQTDQAFSLTIDGENNIYIIGQTESNDFPVQPLPGAYNQLSPSGSNTFILKFSNLGSRLWATYYGGSGIEALSICSDSKNSIYITGRTSSISFPTQFLPGVYSGENYSGGGDAFILKFDNNGKRHWAAYYGSADPDEGRDITVDSKKSVYVVGEVDSHGAYCIDYGNGAYYDNSWNGASDGFILKIVPCNNQKPTSIQTDRNNLCIHETGNIILTAIGGIGDTLKWYSDKAGLNYLGKDTPFTVPVPSQTTTYYARWESVCDTSDCDSVKVIIIPQISINKDHIICSGETYTVGISNYTTAGIYTDTLQSVSGCDSIITTNLTINPTVLNPITESICEGESFPVGTNVYSTPGNYIDVLKTSLGCDSTVTTLLTVNPVPEVSLGADQLLCPGDSITLSPGSGFTSYLWSDGSMLSKLTATSTGKYSVTVYNEWCPASDEVTISECGSELQFPNAFSPNNDYTNDTFKPVILGTLQTYHIIIYDRWGQQIYESNQANPGWDGTLQGSVCATGQYVYTATYLMGTEPSRLKQRVQRGSVTLLK